MRPCRGALTLNFKNHCTQSLLIKGLLSSFHDDDFSKSFHPSEIAIRPCDISNVIIR